jgi:hypothetical protein
MKADILSGVTVSWFSVLIGVWSRIDKHASNKTNMTKVVYTTN